MTFHNATKGLMLSIDPIHTIKINTTVNVFQNIDTGSIILICTQIYIPNSAPRKKKFTTKISTKNISKKLNCLVYILSIKKRWSGKKKNWSEHNHQPPYKYWMSHTITLRVVVNNKLTFVVPYIV